MYPRLRCFSHRSQFQSLLLHVTDVLQQQVAYMDELAMIELHG